jgi:cell division septum initiation protein DivIVA
VNTLPGQLRRLWYDLDEDDEHAFLDRAADELESLAKTNIKLAEHVDELEALLGLKDWS